MTWGGVQQAVSFRIIGFCYFKTSKRRIDHGLYFLYCPVSGHQHKTMQQLYLDHVQVRAGSLNGALLPTCMSSRHSETFKDNSRFLCPLYFSGLIAICSSILISASP